LSWGGGGNNKATPSASAVRYRFEGADDSSKTRLNLVFEHMCNIVVCIPVKVYNMKKKTGLIVTFVSITSLYFYYI
jgi:hypothetical protein